MANTGRKVYLYLKQVDATTGIPTGIVKANVVGDSDYVAPVIDYDVCPLSPPPLPPPSLKASLLIEGINITSGLTVISSGDTLFSPSVINFSPSPHLVQFSIELESVSHGVADFSKEWFTPDNVTVTNVSYVSDKWKVDCQFSSNVDISFDWKKVLLYFAATTFIDGDYLRDYEYANIVGAPLSTPIVTVTGLINSNGGSVKANGIEVYIGQTIAVTLDNNGKGHFPALIVGALPYVNNTGIVATFTLAATPLTGQLGSPSTFQISKAF